QFSNLSSVDFDRHPVWIACHTEDFAEPWFNETDEETFRPWMGALPVGPSDGRSLVRAMFELHDGSRYDGFLNSSVEGRRSRNATTPPLCRLRAFRVLGWRGWCWARSAKGVL